MLSDAPQSELASESVTQDDILALLKTAGLVSSSATSSSAASTSASSSSASTSEAPQKTKQEALKELALLVVQCQEADLLQYTGSKLAQYLKGQPEVDVNTFYAEFDTDAATKLSWVSPELQPITIVHLCKDLELDELEWLYVVLNSGAFLQKIGKPEHVLEAPAPDSEHFDKIAQLMTLAQAVDFGKTNVLAHLSEKLAVSPEPRLSPLKEADELVSMVQQAQSQSAFYPYALSNITWQKGYANTLTHKLAGLDNECASWMYVALSTGKSDHGGYKANPTDYSVLQSIVKQYGREYVIGMLKEHLAKKGLQAPLDACEQHYADQLAKLDPNTQKWLLLELTFKNFPSIPQTGITKPEGDQLAIATKLRDMVYGCADLWSHLQEKLLEGIGPEVRNIAPLIPGLLFSITQQIPDEARLWLYLAITTNTQAPIFDIASRYNHERASDTAIQQMLISDITDHFIFLARTNDMMRQVLKTVLTQKEEPDPGFQAKVKGLPLYEKSFVQNQLQKIGDDAKLWVLYAACFNMQPTEALTIAPDVRVAVPSGRQFDHANLMLNQIHGSPEMRQAYIKELSTQIPAETMVAFRNLVKHYIHTVVDGLNKDDQIWLYLTLRNQEVEDHKIGFKRTYKEPTENKAKASRVLYLLSQYPEMIDEAKAYLKEKNGSIEYVEPTLLEDLGPVSLQLLSPCQMSNLAALNEKQSHQLTFTLLDGLPEPLKVWMAVSLQKGTIDSTSLLMMFLQFGLPQQMIVPIMFHMSNALLLAIKWPSLRETLVEQYGGNKDEMAPFTVIKLDGMPLGDIGFALLTASLKQKADKLQALSVNETGVTDKGLACVAHNLLGRAPLQILQLSNPGVTAAGYKVLLNNPAVLASPAHAIPVMSAVMAELQHPDVQGYLAVQLMSEQIFGRSFIKSQRQHFYQDDSMEKSVKLADSLLAQSGDNPVLQMLLSGFVQNLSKVMVNTQLIHLALAAKNSEMLDSVIMNFSDDVTNEKLRAWMRGCLETGVINTPKIQSESFTEIFGEQPKQSDIIQMLQATALIVAANQEQRTALHQFLDGEAKLLPPIQSVKISKYQVPDSMQSMVALGLLTNPDTLQNVSLKSMALSEAGFAKVCNGLDGKSALISLDISSNELTEAHLASLITLLKNKTLMSLNVSRCQLVGDHLKTLLNAVADSHLQELSICNPSKAEDEPKQITNAMAKDIAQLLGKESCPLTTLDLSNNKISSLGLQYILKALQANPGSQLQSLKVADQATKNDRFESLKSQIDALIAQRHGASSSASASTTAAAEACTSSDTEDDADDSNKKEAAVDDTLPDLGASFDDGLLFSRVGGTGSPVQRHSNPSLPRLEDASGKKDRHEMHRM